MSGSPAVTADDGRAVIDLTHPEFSQDQHAAFAEAREMGPTFVAKPFMVTGFLDHADVEALFSDDRLGAAPGSTAALDAVGVTSEPFNEWITHGITNANPPRHTRMRSLLTKAFTPRRAERMRPVVRSICQELVAELAERGECEFVEDFAQRVPVRAVATMIGVPPADYGVFAAWITDIAPAFGISISREAAERFATAADELQAFCNQLIEEKRRQPADDLLSALIAAEEQGERLSLPELRALIVALLFAGHDTTKSLLASGMNLLIDHPEVFRSLGKDPGLAGPAVEEMLRFEPPIYMTFRQAFEALEYRGTAIESGSFVMLGVAAANRDPKVFERPHVFDVGRTRSKLLSFGLGRHFCVGSNLARLEAEEAFRALCAGLADPHRSIERARWVPMAGVRQLEALPMEFGNKREMEA